MEVNCIYYNGADQEMGRFFYVCASKSVKVEKQRKFTRLSILKNVPSNICNWVNRDLAIFTGLLLIHVSASLSCSFIILAVFICDTGSACYVYIGKKASIDERRKGLQYAHVSSALLRAICTMILKIAVLA